MNILTLTHPLNGLLILAMVIGLAIYLNRRFNLGWRLYWIGVATFILSQVGHLPFNIILYQRWFNNWLPTLPDSTALIVNVLILGLSSGLWEELSRYAVYRWWARDARSWRRAILLGAGHGGVEAFLVGLIILYTYIQIMGLRDIDLTGLVPADQLVLARQQIDLYWSLTWYDSLLGAVERLFTIPFHIAMAVIGLQVFTRQQVRWLWIAVGWHALVNAVAVYTAQVWGPYLSEALIGVNAILSVVVIFALKQPEPVVVDEALPALTIPQLDTIPEVEATTENLENTRYT